MSIKFWEYSGPVDIFYQAYRENASKHMPDMIWYDDPRNHDPLNGNFIHLFQIPLAFKTCLLRPVEDGKPCASLMTQNNVGYRGLQFLTYMSFLYDGYQAQPNFFKHLCVNYCDDQFCIDPGATRIEFMRSMGHDRCKAWIRADRTLPELIHPWLEEVSDLEITGRGYNIIDTPHGWGAIANDKDLMTQYADSRSKFDKLKFEISPLAIKTFYENSSLGFSRPEVHDELHVLKQCFTDNPEWFVEMRSDRSTTDYHVNGQIAIALAAVFANRAITTDWIKVYKT
jgi:hypothetical protein